MATATAQDLKENLQRPLQMFRFQVDFFRAVLPGGRGAGGGAVALCSGAFAECSGLEATMEPKLIKAGGLNYGGAQRVGPVSFATVILKRGVTGTRHLWEWWALVAGGASAYRLDVAIGVQDASGAKVLTWRLARALPVKFKAAELNARTTEVGIEELHLAHEGLRLEVAS
jgi:phage tail-like protein